MIGPPVAVAEAFQSSVLAIVADLAGDDIGPADHAPALALDDESGSLIDAEADQVLELFPCGGEFINTKRPEFDGRARGRDRERQAGSFTTGLDPRENGHASVVAEDLDRPAIEQNAELDRPTPRGRAAPKRPPQVRAFLAAS